ncbi:MAG: hypothetical protein A2Y34_01650 [Spirochaetes bacterium GWC1_27_15]|nr:MAG: hypothetical protein A2Z98_17430 [Spirochaetes bacterium GWB1_27_13]OHD26638.1 MAG: hypothetical protein A2Y34_01650 [Spirochaetes bacterium GWC1_27_15]
MNDKNFNCYNIDCIEGSKKYLKDNFVDLIITDPPYGIDGHLLHKHYKRNEDFVIDGYQEVGIKEYPEFSKKWIKEAERVLRPGGSIYIVSGYTNLVHILNALRETSLVERNHIIWKYNFGVYTQKKFVSSHYHILYYIKPPESEITFNTNCRYNQSQKTENGRSKLYNDMQDVWQINKKYKPQEKKNKNELPEELLLKMILYSSNPNDVVCDFFGGSFSTIKVAIGTARYGIGFELNTNSFTEHLKELEETENGFLLENLIKPEGFNIKNKGKKWTKEEIESLITKYKHFTEVEKLSKKKSIEKLSLEFDRGNFSIKNILEKYNTDFTQIIAD